MHERKKHTSYGEIIKRILKGEGKASVESRQSAFDNSGLTEPLRTLVDKIAYHSAKVTDENIKEVISSGTGEDQVFELVICAAAGQASRQYESALKALTEAINKTERQKDAT